MDIVLADTRYILFTTRAFATGIPTVLAGTPVVSAYENEGLTQITAGITLGVDHDSVVGLNLLTIVATGANGFEDDKDYSFVITTGTVGGVSVVGEVVGHFSIQRAPVNWANVSNPTTALDLSGTDIQLVDTVTAYTGNTPQTADHTAGIADIPTVSEFNARTLVAASYFDPAADAVANVTLVATTTTNTDMRGTDSAATAANLATVDSNVDAILVDTGTTIPATLGTPAADVSADIAAVKADTAAILVDTGTTLDGKINTIDTNVDSILVDTSTTLPGLIDDLAIKKNATFSNFEFLMVLTSDHVTPATGLTVTGQRSIDGGAFAAVGGAIAEVSNGIYQFDALAADTNGDVITWRFLSATADDAFITFKTVA